MKQLIRVRDAIKDGNWYTLEEIAVATGDKPQSIASRLRDLRLNKFGGLRVEARIKDRSKQVWEYRLISQVNVRSASPQPTPAHVVAVNHLSRQPQSPVRFLNINSWRAETVPYENCKVVPCGPFTRVVATDDSGDIIPHLVTTQSELSN